MSINFYDSIPRLNNCQPLFEDGSRWYACGFRLVTCGVGRLVGGDVAPACVVKNVVICLRNWCQTEQKNNLKSPNTATLKSSHPKPRLSILFIVFEKMFIRAIF